jgi:hypothetical protein
MGAAPQSAALVGPGAVPPGEGAVVDRVVVVTSTVRRRSRQAVSRSKVVQFSLTEEEFDEVSAAAAQAGLARGAFAADVTLAAACLAAPRPGLAHVPRPPLPGVRAQVLRRGARLLGRQPQRPVAGTVQPLQLPDPPRREPQPRAATLPGLRAVLPRLHPRCGGAVAGDPAGI